MSIRLTLSVIAGVLVALLVTFIVAVVPIPWLQIFGPITHNIPLFCGGIVGGYIAQKHWWLSGIIIGITAAICLLLFMIMMGAANFGLAKSAEMAVQMRPSMWWEIIQEMSLCIAGACLGHFFARLIRKKQRISN